MILEARKLNKTYGKGRRALRVLKDINLKVREGEFLAIVGPSGAGKSTLLHLLGGIDYPTRGEVFLDDTNLYRLPEEEISRLLNRNVGFVFQFYHLLPDFTAFENVIMPAMIAGNNAREKAEGLIRKFGLRRRMHSVPTQLSGGEQQRFAMIRALINEPRILLCDEPTGNLDSQNGERVISMLQELNARSQTTVVLVTHNEGVARNAKRVVHLRDGKIK